MPCPGLAEGDSNVGTMFMGATGMGLLPIIVPVDQIRDSVAQAHEEAEQQVESAAPAHQDPPSPVAGGAPAGGGIGLPLGGSVAEARELEQVPAAGRATVAGKAATSAPEAHKLATE